MRQLSYNVSMYKRIIFTVIFILEICKTTAFGQEDFTADYSITYEVANSGITTVTNSINIINQKPDVIATTYTLSLNQQDLFDIQASDNLGNLDIVKKEQGEITNLDIKLNNFVIGTGKKNEFKVIYKTRYIANKIGDIWNVTIPKSQSPTTNKYHIKMIIPKELGPKIFISPTAFNEEKNLISTTYYFEDKNLSSENISASFGQAQTLNFKLRYQIENPNYFTSNFEIALPPTIKNSQLVSYSSLEPMPIRTYTDKDGNYMAVYRLKPKENLDIVLKGSTKIVSSQIDINKSKMIEDIPSKTRQLFTSKQIFWETDSVTIQDIAKKLFDPNLNVAQNTLKIYTYLVDNYSYDFEIAKKDYVDRSGAEKALNNRKNWGCMEFTDSFIAIARAMGIPAREINGYAINSSDNLHPISVAFRTGDLLHAWPEFYDQYYGWVQIDPTWGNTSNTDYFTKLDTNHFAFVKKGVQSEYPLPVGAYRIFDNQKLVEVDFAQIKDEDIFTGKFSAKTAVNFNPIDIFKLRKKYKVSNDSNVVMITPDNRQILPGQSLYVKIEDNQELVLLDALGKKYKF